MNQVIQGASARTRSLTRNIARRVGELLDRRSPETLELPFDAARRDRERPDLGRLVTYEDLSGAGCPILLIHSVNAAACAKEMQPLFEEFRGERPVIAVDLPGFGASRASGKLERSVYHSALSDLLVELHERFGKPVDVVASSLSAELAAVAICNNQACVRSFWMLSPTGFAKENPVERLGREQISERRRRLSGLLGRAVFRVLRTRPALHYYLSRATQRPSADLGRYMQRSAAQRGAHRAPLLFLSGALFEPNVRSRYYARLGVPTWILYGDDPFTRFDDVLAFAGSHPRVQAERVEGARGLVQFDATRHCVDKIRGELAGLDRFEARCEVANDVQSGWT